MSQSPVSTTSRTSGVSPLKYSIGYNFGVATSGDELLKEMEVRARSILERHSPAKVPAASANIFSSVCTLSSPPQGTATSSRMRRHVMASQQRSPGKSSRRFTNSIAMQSSPKLDSPLRRMNLGPPNPAAMPTEDEAETDLESPKRRANGPESPTKRRRAIDTPLPALSRVPPSGPLALKPSSMSRSSSTKSFAPKMTRTTSIAAIKEAKGDRVVSGEVRAHTRSTFDFSVNTELKPPPSMVRSQSQHLRSPSESKVEPAKKPSFSARSNQTTKSPALKAVPTATPLRLPRSATFSHKLADNTKPAESSLQRPLSRPVLRKPVAESARTPVQRKPSETTVPVQRKSAETTLPIHRKPSETTPRPVLRKPVPAAASTDDADSSSASLPSYARPTKASMRRSVSSNIAALGAHPKRP